MQPQWVQVWIQVPVLLPTVVSVAPADWASSSSNGEADSPEEQQPVRAGSEQVQAQEEFAGHEADLHRMRRMGPRDSPVGEVWVWEPTELPDTLEARREWAHWLESCDEPASETTTEALAGSRGRHFCEHGAERRSASAPASLRRNRDSEVGGAEVDDHASKTGTAEPGEKPHEWRERRGRRRGGRRLLGGRAGPRVQSAPLPLSNFFKELEAEEPADEGAALPGGEAAGAGRRERGQERLGRLAGVLGSAGAAAAAAPQPGDAPEKNTWPGDGTQAAARARAGAPHAALEGGRCKHRSGRRRPRAGLPPAAGLQPEARPPQPTPQAAPQLEPQPEPARLRPRAWPEETATKPQPQPPRLHPRAWQGEAKTPEPQPPRLHPRAWQGQAKTPEPQPPRLHPRGPASDAGSTATAELGCHCAGALGEALPGSNHTGGEGSVGDGTGPSYARTAGAACRGGSDSSTAAESSPSPSPASTLSPQTEWYELSPPRAAAAAPTTLGWWETMPEPWPPPADSGVETPEQGGQEHVGTDPAATQLPPCRGTVYREQFCLAKTFQAWKAFAWGLEPDEEWWQDEAASHGWDYLRTNGLHENNHYMFSKVLPSWRLKPMSES